MLSRQDYECELGKGINIYPFNKDNIKENSINLTVGQYAWSLGSGKVWLTKNGNFVFGKDTNNSNLREVHLHKGSNAIIKINSKHSILILLPHSTTIVETREIIGLSNYIGGSVHSKVGVSAIGIGHIGTMLGPCFCGHLMIALHNITDKPIQLSTESTFASMIFYKLNSSVLDNKNSNMTGHVDKLSELGIKVQSDTRKYLTEDWKQSLEGIRDKMSNDNEFIKYKEELKKKRQPRFKKYINAHNIFLALILLGIVLFLFWVVTYIDKRNNDTFWRGVYCPIVASVFILPLGENILKSFKKNY